MIDLSNLWPWKPQPTVVFPPDMGGKKFLGKKPARKYSVQLRVGEYIQEVVSVPKVFGFTQPTIDWGVLGNFDCGDCHDDKTEVLTEVGWQRWPDYDGASLATLNPVTEALEYQTPSRIIRRKHDGLMYYSNHKSLDFALTPKHRMLHWSYTSGFREGRKQSFWGEDLRFTELDQLSTRILIPNAPKLFLGTGLKTLKIGDRVWDGDDLISLLGILVSDGWVESGWNRVYYVGFVCHDEQRRRLLEPLIHRLGLSESKTRRGVWVWTDRALADWLRANAYSGTTYRSPFKRVPAIVKWAEPRQIELFLKFFGDRNRNSDREVYYTSSLSMADDIQELLLRLGKKSFLTSTPPALGGTLSDGRVIKGKYPSYAVSVKKRPTAVQFGGEQPQVEKEYYKGEVFCATVPNSTLITRRNGQTLISGQCVVAGAAHETMLWSRAAKKGLVIFDDAGIKTQYRLASGWNGKVGDPSDVGLDMQEFASLRRKVGLVDSNGVTHKIKAYAAVSGVNELLQAIYIFGAVGVGVMLPQSASDQFDARKPWTVVKNSRVLGGHYVPAIGRNRHGHILFITWGRIQAATPEFVARYMDEAIAYISVDFLTTSGLSPRLVNQSKLEADLAALAT